MSKKRKKAYTNNANKLKKSTKDMPKKLIPALLTTIISAISKEQLPFIVIVAIIFIAYCYMYKN